MLATRPETKQTVQKSRLRVMYQDLSKFEWYKRHPAGVSANERNPSNSMFCPELMVPCKYELGGEFSFPSDTHGSEVRMGKEALATRDAARRVLWGVVTIAPSYEALSVYRYPVQIKGQAPSFL